MDVVELVAVAVELELDDRIERNTCRDNSNRVEESVPPLTECMLAGKQLEGRNSYQESGRRPVWVVSNEPADAANMYPNVIKSGCQLKTCQLLLLTNLVSRPEVFSRLVHE